MSKDFVEHMYALLSDCLLSVDISIVAFFTEDGFNPVFFGFHIRFTVFNLLFIMHSVLAKNVANIS